jgi:hypothetical protein
VEGIVGYLGSLLGVGRPLGSQEELLLSISKVHKQNHRMY